MKSERARQKRIEHKRARRVKRVERRLARDARAGDWTERAPALPLVLLDAPKMSETLLEFAAPLLDLLGGRGDAGLCQGALARAAEVWNWVVFADMVGTDPDPARQVQPVRREIVERFARTWDREPEDAEHLVAALEARKRALFGPDRRVVLRVHAEEQGDEIRVYAMTAAAESGAEAEG